LLKSTHDCKIPCMMFPSFFPLSSLSSDEKDLLLRNWPAWCTRKRQSTGSKDTAALPPGPCSASMIFECCNQMPPSFTI
jgi:hypothetical protein